MSDTMIVFDANIEPHFAPIMAEILMDTPSHYMRKRLWRKRGTSSYLITNNNAHVEKLFVGMRKKTHFIDCRVMLV